MANLALLLNFVDVTGVLPQHTYHECCGFTNVLFTLLLIKNV